MSDLCFVSEILQMEPADFEEKKKPYLFKSERAGEPEFSRLDTTEISVLKCALKSIPPTTLTEIVYQGKNGTSVIKCYIGPLLGDHALTYLRTGPKAGRWCSLCLLNIMFVSELLI